MRDQIVSNLRARFSAYADLIVNVDEAMLTVRIEVPKHKSLGEHLWCVVGARESYARAITAGEWDGFSCSMSTFSRSDFLGKLDQSARSVIDAIEAVDDWTNEREELLVTLAEHEVMHEGQIIRHMYGAGESLPSSWKWA